eukprot:scaffold1208_cov299-Prasinococcus_capsulatus_cf.AAC.1
MAAGSAESAGGLGSSRAAGGDKQEGGGADRDRANEDEDGSGGGVAAAITRQSVRSTFSMRAVLLQRVRSRPSPRMLVGGICGVVAHVEANACACCPPRRRSPTRGTSSFSRRRTARRHPSGRSPPAPPPTPRWRCAARCGRMRCPFACARARLLADGAAGGAGPVPVEYHHEQRAVRHLGGGAALRAGRAGYRSGAPSRFLAAGSSGVSSIIIIANNNNNNNSSGSSNSSFLAIAPAVVASPRKGSGRSGGGAAARGERRVLHVLRGRGALPGQAPLRHGGSRSLRYVGAAAASVALRLRTHCRLSWGGGAAQGAWR